ncbi:DUF2306 domain-containing protein [Bacillaceae bacterium SIJ1]|uniref:DUF2306 domain-containing protein n=1 Tax=Litoribacterium kuwaitense TaxID=1398745 RepID=UPI0013EB75DD|nr:DUF2306 domain-containing protein [Litoribacterium kuwaitense]NGP46870.1 DUF2306 domain-containing protein [Litoribacterium kuwaitense]
MFTIFLIIHISTGFICLITGVIAMTSRKTLGKHSLSGELYHWSYVFVFITTVVMSIIHWEDSAHLFYIGAFSYALAFIGYVAAKVRKKYWLRSHIGGMLGSYIGVVTATIVVNVPKIPVLNDLPPLLFWFLPTLIGTPLIFNVVKKYTLQMNS